MSRRRTAAVGEIIGPIVYFGAGLYMVVAVFSYFHEWGLPIWQWVGALVVAPITFVVVPFYVGFTEGDWSLVAAWAGAIGIYALCALISSS